MQMGEHQGTFVGHVVPGLIFFLDGLWGFRAARQPTAPFATPFSSAREATLIIVAAIGGAIGELWWASWRMTDSSVINYQHATMYMGFAFAAGLYLLARRGVVSARLPFVAIGGAYGATALLFGKHGSHMPVSGAIHGLLASLLLAAACVALAEGARPSPALAVTRTGLTTAIGAWFFVAAWILYRSSYDLMSGDVVMRIYLFFIWDLMLVSLVFLALHVRFQAIQHVDMGD